jgi:D-glycero-alpha-D-manno-heptose-7-phosphate kinase
MIISRTPMRISFVGGGSDLPLHYRRFGGAVVSVAITKYVFITVNQRFDSTIRLSYSKTEEVAEAKDIEHRLVRAAMMRLDVHNGIEITSIADIPSSGSGLGSSSAFTVGLLNALYAYKGAYRSKADLASEACTVEIDLCGQPIGKQDQFGAALGGLNLIRFHPDETVSFEPVIGPPGFVDRFQSSLLLFYTGATRSASQLLQKQIDEMAANRGVTDRVTRMAAMTENFSASVRSGDFRGLGEILHEGWMLKKSIASVGSDWIDAMYDRARQAGALGGKILGAGGGGFMLVMADPDRHDAIRAALADYRCIPFRFDWSGSTIIFYHPAEQ